MHLLPAMTPSLTERRFIAIKALLLCLSACLVCVVPNALLAKDTFSIAGRVKTAKGRAFAMAIVKVDNGMGMTVAVFSKHNGRFAIKGFKPGRYEVSAEQAGYLKVSQSIVIPGAKSVSLVLLEGPPSPRDSKPGKDNVHQTMNTSLSPPPSL
jgi:hypothetical protein